jgi:hypothetical protein
MEGGDFECVLDLVERGAAPLLAAIQGALAMPIAR